MLRKKGDNKGVENENQKENGYKNVKEEEEKERKKMKKKKKKKKKNKKKNKKKKSSSDNWGRRSEKEEVSPIGAGFGSGSERLHHRLTKIVGIEEEE